MTQSGALLFALTGIVAALAAVLAFAVLRFFAAARALSRKREGAETALMVAAVEEAVQRVRHQEQAMKARAEASERLSEEIISSMTSGLLVVGDNHQVRTLNPAGRKLLGLPEADWSGDLREVLAGAAPLADVIEECLATAKPIVRRSIRIPRGAASAGHFGVTVSPIRDREGVLHGAMCLFSDLSEIFALEDQLRLKDSLARVGEMTAGIAHEFRNSLATIHGYARLLDLERLPEDFRPYVTGIREETASLREVVTNFLNFAKPAQLSVARVDVGALAERAADEIHADVVTRHGSITVRGEFGPVDGDEVLLRQAFLNLCRNALEACSEAGVAPQIVVEGTVDRALRQQRVTVTDNGAGIESSLAEQVFRPFFTTKSDGIGLGLALVQKVVVTHNGRVTLMPHSGAGARFQVTLPLASDGV
jgi:signal transduction histidine kinase